MRKRGIFGLNRWRLVFLPASDSLPSYLLTQPFFQISQIQESEEAGCASSYKVIESWEGDKNAQRARASLRVVAV